MLMTGMLLIVQNIVDANLYTQRKISDIDGKLTKIQQAIDQKQNNLIQIQMVFQAKLASARQQQGKK